MLTALPSAPRVPGRGPRLRPPPAYAATPSRQGDACVVLQPCPPDGAP